VNKKVINNAVKYLKEYSESEKRIVRMVETVFGNKEEQKSFPEIIELKIKTHKQKAADIDTVIFQLQSLVYKK
jgi:hypothetical protein